MFSIIFIEQCKAVTFTYLLLVIQYFLELVVGNLSIYYKLEKSILTNVTSISSGWWPHTVSHSLVLAIASWIVSIDDGPDVIWLWNFHVFLISTLDDVILALILWHVIRIELVSAAIILRSLLMILVVNLNDGVKECTLAWMIIANNEAVEYEPSMLISLS